MAATKVEKVPFWRGLDSSSPEVADCERDYATGYLVPPSRDAHRHRWTEIRVGDVLGDDALAPDAVLAVCARCCVLRCGAPGDDACLLPIHHTEHHRFASGKSAPIGGWNKPKVRASVQ